MKGDVDDWNNICVELSTEVKDREICREETKEGLWRDIEICEENEGCWRDVGMLCRGLV